LTLVIAAQGIDFVVLGTDSRGTIQDGGGTRVELNIMMKLTKISKFVGILMYGSADQATYFIHKFKSTLKGENHNASEIAEKLADLCRHEARKVNDVPAVAFPTFGFVITGLDKKGTKYIPRCYTLDSGSGFRLGMSKHGFALEGKPMIAYYLFAKMYNKEMNVPDLCTLVAQTLYDTIKVDGDVGGKMRIAIIDSSGIREFPEGDINTWITKWELPS
jgi:20S proteasome alpha/beta subunit